MILALLWSGAQPALSLRYTYILVWKGGWLEVFFTEIRTEEFSFRDIVHVCLVTSVCVQLFVTPWAIARQTHLSMGFSREEYWSGLPCPPPGDLPSPGIESMSPALQVDSLPFEPPGKPMNTTEVFLSFLQGIFPTQESNWGLPAELPGKPKFPLVVNAKNYIIGQYS